MLGWLRIVASRIWGWLLGRHAADEEFARELESHLEMLAQENVRRGMTPEEARRAARVRLGGMTQISERHREMHTLPLLETFVQDIRYGLRTLWKSPGLTSVAVLTLALGIGANTAIFSLADLILLRALPVSHPEQLVTLSRSSPGGEGESFPYPAFEQFQGARGVFSKVFGFAFRSARTSFGDRPVEAVVELASGEYFRALGTPAAVGRTLTAEDDVAQGKPAAVISFRVWQDRFGSDPAVLGTTLSLNSLPVTIVGVMPPSFFGTSLDYTPDVWIPIKLQPQLDGASNLDSAGVNWVMVMARLKPGDSASRAAVAANLIFQRYLRSTDADPKSFEQRIELAAGGKPVSRLRYGMTQPVMTLGAIVGLVLLLACANLTNLLLAKGASRKREIAVRLAIGAGRLRLVQQLFTESLLLAVLGGAAGLILAEWGSNFLMDFARALEHSLPPQIQFHADVRVLLFVGGVSLLAAILFGLTPALRATRVDLTPGLKDIIWTAGLSRLRLNKLLLVSQVAICLPLLVVAGLFIRSFQRLSSVDLGFDAQKVVQVKSAVLNPEYTPARLTGDWDQIMEAIRATPGVASASASSPGLFSHSVDQTNVVLGDTQLQVHNLRVTPGFFRTLQIPLLRGRDFTSADQVTAVQVTILDETLARQLFGSANPIGRQIHSGYGPDALEIVGVAKDTKYDSVLSRPPAMFYVPLAQHDLLPNFRVFEVRTSADSEAAAATLNKIVQSVDPGLPAEIRPLTSLIGESLLIQRLTARVTGFFGALGLLLACIGLYGLVSYIVTQRTSEVGIRVAMGAERLDIVRMVMREATTLVLIGLGIGLAFSVAVTRLAGSQLFGLTATDPITFLAATLLMLSLAALASYLPARRAAHVDPMVALRYE